MNTPKEVLILNSLTGPLTVGFPRPVELTDGKPPRDSVMLPPGVSRMTAAAWAVAEEQVMVKHLIKMGSLEKLGGTNLPKSDPAAIKLIKETTDRLLLEDWLDVARKEGRGSIRRALSKQLEEIAPTAPNSDDEEEDEEVEPKAPAVAAQAKRKQKR